MSVPADCMWAGEDGRAQGRLQGHGLSNWQDGVVPLPGEGTGAAGPGESRKLFRGFGVGPVGSPLAGLEFRRDVAMGVFTMRVTFVFVS